MSELDNIFRSINKKYADGKYDIATVGLVEKKFDLVSFGSPGVDYSTYGGWPLGRLIELFGPESSGKTTTAIKMCAEYQKLPDAKEIVYVDLEDTFDVRWAKIHNLDVTKLRMISPEGMNAEQILDIVCQIIETGEVGLVVIDSIPMLVPALQFDNSMEKGNIGGVAKALTLFCAKVIPLLKKNETTCIAINQVRDDMDSMYNAYTTPGGRAFKHACTLRIETRGGDKFNMKGEVVSKTAENAYGQYIKTFIRKSKICPPNRLNGMYTLVYTKGVDELQDLIRVATLFDLVQQQGAMYTIIDGKTGEVIVNEEGQPVKFRGKNAVVEYYKANPQAYNDLKAYTLEKLKDQGDTYNYGQITEEE